MDAKKTISSHFRILCLSAMLAAIVVFSFSAHDQRETLPFRTYSFSVQGSGDVSGVKALFDFKNGTQGMVAEISPGNYTLRSSTGAAAMVNGKGVCLAKDSGAACQFEVAQNSSLAVLFNESQMMPNGRFRLSFPSKTDAVVKIVLGDAYKYKDLLSVLPRDVHGHYAPEDNVVIIQTLSDVVGDEGKTEFVDFDLYSLDQKAYEANRQNDWRQDIIIEPLVIAFLLLFISDIIDYAHKYLREKYARDDARKGAKR